MLIKHVSAAPIHDRVIIAGWIKTAREAGSKDRVWLFLEINDGSCLDNIQVVMNKSVVIDAGFSLKDISTTGASIQIQGMVVKAPVKAKQDIEIKCEKILHFGKSDSQYPFAKKFHGIEHLRDHLYLRARTSLTASVLRVRSTLVQTTHEFFSSRDFFNVTTPIMTNKDVETAGQTFQISSNTANIKANLTVSGQIHAECLANGLGRVYSFGPTFRAENSHTKRHLAEFWMLEPELIFTDMHETMSLVQDYLKECAKMVNTRCFSEIRYLQNHSSTVDDMRAHDGLLGDEFQRISYDKALRILHDASNGGDLKVPSPEYGQDLASEHEQYLTCFYKGPVFVHDWPAETKPFYMRLNDDKKTCAAFDLLLPFVGELVGGGQREERYDDLRSMMSLHKVSDDEYLALRRWGTVPHSGFGVGFDRLVMLFTGMNNIRDVIPFPRWSGSCVS